MEKKQAYHWRLMKQENPELYTKVQAWRNELSDNDVIPPKYKQLIMLAMACALRYERGIRTHGRMALEAGATREELYATVAQSMTIGGIPAYRTGCDVLEEIFGNV
jgi:4-carboxymuconolactone decarboxylase